MIVDTHLHLIDQQALRYDWLAGVPALDRSFTYEDYAGDAGRAGIGSVLHMEVDVDPADMEAETAFVGRLAAAPGSLIAGAIAACRPEEPGFPDYLQRQRENPLVKGFRRVLHVVPDDLSERPLFRENIRRLGDTALPFDLVVQTHQIGKAIALADSAPDVQFVLDHCGNPGIRDGAEHPWRGLIAEIARRPNVAVKLSGLVNNADPERWTAQTLRPYAGHVIESFGWDRVVWGSDWPVCTLGGGLLAWVAATHSLLSDASLEERTKLLSGNARRLWRLG